jgi:hypothetical protein
MGDKDSKEQVGINAQPEAGLKKPLPAGQTARPEMQKRVTKKDDGRSLIYYTFGEAK